MSAIQNLISNPLEILYRLAAIIVALSFHEAAHAFVAYKCGDPTAANMGRMTVNPLKHIDPIGFVCLLLFRFGWAKPVPVNPRNFRNERRDDTLVSLAGVITNFIIANIAMLIWYFCSYVLQFWHPVLDGFMVNMILVNIGLMVFNLLPIPPLDGYHVFKNLLIGKIKPTFFWNYERYGQFVLFAVILGGSWILSTLMGGVLGAMESFYTAIFSLFV